MRGTENVKSPAPHKSNIVRFSTSTRQKSAYTNQRLCPSGDEQRANKRENSARGERSLPRHNNDTDGGAHSEPAASVSQRQSRALAVCSTHREEFMKRGLLFARRLRRDDRLLFFITTSSWSSEHPGKNAVTGKNVLHYYPSQYINLVTWNAQKCRVKKAKSNLQAVGM